MAADGSAARRAGADRPVPPAAARAARPRPPAALDNLIHHRLRLGNVSALAATERLTFNELKGLMNTTDGNLSVHARKLEDAGYVTCTKGFDGRRPRTEYGLTALGRKELSRYLTHMEALIRATRDTMGR
jgi:DNA-binding HxlR family transcriptional regulator